MISTVGKRAMADEKQTLRISLIPEGGESFKAVNLGRRIWSLAIFAMLCFAAIFAAVFIVKGMERSSIAKIDGLKSQITNIKSETDKSMGDYQKVSLFSRQIKAAGGIMSSHYSFVKVFQLIESRTLPGVYYTNIVGATEGKSFVLEARARDFEEAARQIVALREDPRVAKTSVTAITADVSESGVLSDVKFVMTIVVNENTLK